MTTFSKAEYLQRYLSPDKKETEKKKKKKKLHKATGLRIVEDDAFIAVAAQFKNVDSDEEKEDIAIISSITKQVEEKAREGPRFRNSFQPLAEVKCEPSSPSAEESKIGNMSLECCSSQGPPSKSHFDSDNGLLKSQRMPRRRHDSDSDQSVQRYSGVNQEARRTRLDSNQSPSRRIDRDGGSVSPRRYGRSHKESTTKADVDSDLSPSRKERPKSSIGSDSDHSPPRKQCKGTSHGPNRRAQRSSERSRRRKESDSDQSPPRKHGDSRARRRDQDRPRGRRVATPELLGKETKRTLDGKIAGLQSADDLKKESEELRQREAKMFEELDSSVSGRNAVTILRQKQVRKGKDKPEDKERKEREAKKQAELQEKYDLWNKGVVQAETRGQQMEEMARVAAEPLARMADDKEMNKHLKSIIHEEDPMAAILQSKKREDAIDRGELVGIIVYPTYQGEFPPNRFGIRPGYRWDGVDRSNGFEAKLARAKNVRNAEDREFYQNIQLYE